MIQVVQGGMYPGETYIYCAACRPDPLAATGVGLFQGEGLLELGEFFLAHLHRGHAELAEAIAPGHTG